MAGDAPSGHDAGSGSPLLPPVFTYRPGPSVETAGGPVAPPFLPEREGSAPASGVESTDPQPSAAATEPSPEPRREPAATTAEPATAAPAVAATDLEADEDAEFPLEAFIVPEEADRLPAGMEAPNHSRSSAAAPQPPALDRAARLADRLEALAHRLRAEGPAALGAGIESGDRFDAVLTGLLAGYLAAGDE